MLKFTKIAFYFFIFVLISCTSNTTIDTELNTQRPPHHLSNGRFQNPPASPSSLATIRDMVKFFSNMMFSSSKVIVPNDHVLGQNEQLTQLVNAGNPSITWLGHATFILRVGGKVILTDPYLEKTAGPWNLGPKRFVDAPLKAHQLPKADIMLISHNHYDHLDAITISAYPWKQDTQVIVPLGLGEFFVKRGYSKVLEQDWWNEWRLDELTITTLPAVHFSGRGIGDRNKTLWASFAITTDEQKIWFSGDTARGKIFQEIGQRAGPFDYALVAIGAYEPRKIMQDVHVTPEEAIEICHEIGARKAIAMHWGTIMLTPENPFDAPVRFRQAATDQVFGEENAWIMKIGETRSL